MFFKKDSKKIKQDVSYKQNTTKYEIIVFKKTMATEFYNRNVNCIGFEPIIRLENLKTCFRTPYNGYLCIDADYSELHFDDNSYLIINKSLNKFYLDKNISIRIINAKNLTSATFMQY